MRSGQEGLKYGVDSNKLARFRDRFQISLLISTEFNQVN